MSESDFVQVVTLRRQLKSSRLLSLTPGSQSSFQLSFSQHVQKIVSKARARIGLLFAKLPIQNIPFQLVVQLFDTYIAPLFHYGLCLWASNCSHSSLQALDAVWTKYLKRYLGLPPFANNSIVYHVTETLPLSYSLKVIAPQKVGGLVFPNCFSGLKLSFIPSIEDIPPMPDLNPTIPTTFWMSRMINVLPSTKYYRHRLMREITDFKHKDICTVTNFHIKPTDDCKCKYCNQPAHPYHIRFCTASVD